MKKIMVVLVGIFCLTAILVVSFFGTLPFDKEPNIYCDYIVMQMPEQYRDSSGDLVYETLRRPDDEMEALKDPNWYDNDYSYRIRISSIAFILEKLNCELNLNCEARTNKVDKEVTDKQLNFYCIDPSETYTSYLKIENNKITFKNDPSLYPSSSMNAFTFMVQSHDAHKKFIYIRMQIQGITTEETSL